MPTPIILHIDFDSFFASVVQQDQPEFRNKPIAVTAANGRTAIIAASKEAKVFGIKTGSRTFDAFQICPQLLLAQGDFRRYFAVSKKFLALCTLFSPTVELFSIDEVFMDVTLTAKLFGGVDPLIRVFKKKLAQEVGEYITASVGISHNKLLAKLASGMNKPNGVYEIRPDNLEVTYKKAKLTDICGIGFRICRRLNLMGIYTLLQLRSTAQSFLIQEFGQVEGRFLYNVGQGIGSTDVLSYTHAREAKSVSRNYCLPHNEYNMRVVDQNMFELCEEIGVKLRRLGKKAHTIGLSLRGDKNYGAKKRVTEYLDSGSQLYAICHSLRAAWPLSYVRMISVWSGDFVDANASPIGLFENAKGAALQKTIDTLNDRFGDHTIRNGFLLYSEKLTTVPNGFLTDTWDRTILSTSELVDESDITRETFV